MERFTGRISTLLIAAVVLLGCAESGMQSTSPDFTGTWVDASQPSSGGSSPDLVLGDCTRDLEYEYSQAIRREDGVWLGPAGLLGADDPITAVGIVRDNLESFAEVSVAQADEAGASEDAPEVATAAQAPSKASLLDVTDDEVRASHEDEGDATSRFTIDGTTAQGWPGTSTFEDFGFGWQFGGPTAVPAQVWIGPVAHHDLDDLPVELSAELGPFIQRVSRAIGALPGVGRVHVNWWGDGAAHLHLLLIARPHWAAAA